MDQSRRSSDHVSDRPTIAGVDVADGLMAQHGFADVMFLRIAGRWPTPHQVRMLDALLVMLIEHGLTPSAISARMTILSEPGALVPAVASGLLGAGSRFLGTADEVVDTLVRHLAGSEPTPTDAAGEIVALHLDSHRPIPGLGHPIHREIDPRARVIEDILRSDTADTTGFDTILETRRLLEERGRPMVLNAAGAMGAALYDLRFPLGMGRAIALVSRAAGLVGHVLDEAEHPVAADLWNLARERLDAPQRSHLTHLQEDPR